MTRTSKAGREVGSGGTGTEGERVRWFSSPVVVLVYCQARMVVGRGEGEVEVILVSLSCTKEFDEMKLTSSGRGKWPTQFIEETR